MTVGSSKSVLIIGGSGQLGTALRQCLGDRAVAPAHADFDVMSDDLGPLLDRSGASAVVNCFAFHNVDRCEREPDAAFDANAIVVERLAAASARRDVLFTTISTDYVFSGDEQRAYVESDPVAPRTVYGTSKVAGELLTRRHGDNHIIVRTSGMFGTTGTSGKGHMLIEKVLGQAERGEATRMVADVVFSPAYAPHVARAIVACIDRRAVGTHHITNAGACSWYEFVEAAFGLAGLADAPLQAVTYASFGNPTPRPMYSPLANATFSAAGIEPLPGWRDALVEFLAHRARRADAVVR